MFGMTEMWHFKQCGFKNAARVNYSTRVKYSNNTVCTVPVRINISALNVLNMWCDIYKYCAILWMRMRHFFLFCQSSRYSSFWGGAWPILAIANAKPYQRKVSYAFAFYTCISLADHVRSFNVMIYLTTE